MVFRASRPSEDDPKRVPNGAPKATRAEKSEFTKLEHSTKDSLDFSSPRSFCRRSRLLLERSWKHLEASFELLEL